MHLLAILRVAGALAAVAFSTIGVWAYPHSSSRAIGALGDGERERNQLDLRTLLPRAGIVISMMQRPGHNTWTGYQTNPLHLATISDQTLKDTARLTYESMARTLPGGSLISVVYVPKAGYAAGTIWQGTDRGFEDFARSSPNVWHSIPLPEQASIPSLHGVHKYHAEAVAMVVAETEFNHLFEQGIFPEGTKIYTYGQYWAGAWYVGGKYSCGDGGTGSQVQVPCAEWLGRLGVKLIPP